MRVITMPGLPIRHRYEHGDTLPAGVDLGVGVGPWWTVTAVDPRWNHIATMGVQWQPDRQFCRTGIHDCVPAVTLTSKQGTRSLHWCADHAADADVYQDPDTYRTEGGPGRWVEVPDGQTRLIVCDQASGDRHPDLDGRAYPDASAAMRAAWDAGLLALIVFPGLAARA